MNIHGSISILMNATWANQFDMIQTQWRANVGFFGKAVSCSFPLNTVLFTIEKTSLPTRPKVLEELVGGPHMTLFPKDLSTSKSRKPA